MDCFQSAGNSGEHVVSRDLASIPMEVEAGGYWKYGKEGPSPTGRVSCEWVSNNNKKVVL
jgi:hypothetical protein